MPNFLLYDSSHMDIDFEFETFELALQEIRRLATVPWDEEPNRAPCSSWRTCGRFWDIRECEAATGMHLTKTPIVEIDAEGVRWQPGFGPENEKVSRPVGQENL